MYGMDIQVTQNSASPSVRALSVLLRSDRLREAAGRGAANVVREHLFALDNTRPNRYGGDRTHFWRDAAQSVSHSLLANGIRVSITHEGMAQRYYGGTIRPVISSWLAIPVNPSHPAASSSAREAYGRLPREFPFLRAVIYKPGVLGALIARPHTRVRARNTKRGVRFKATGDTTEGVYYWLKKEVTQQPDPSVLPPDNVILDAAARAASSIIDAAWRQA